MKLEPIGISKAEYESFRELVKVPRPGWQSVFSVNGREEVWPYVCRKKTPLKDRQYVPLEDYPRLCQVAQYFISNVDECGGRFFINYLGVYFVRGEAEPPGIHPEQFISWKCDENISPVVSMTVAEARELGKIRSD